MYSINMCVNVCAIDEWWRWIYKMMKSTASINYFATLIERRKSIWSFQKKSKQNHCKNQFIGFVFYVRYSSCTPPSQNQKPVITVYYTIIYTEPRTSHTLSHLILYVCIYWSVYSNRTGRSPLLSLF